MFGTEATEQTTTTTMTGNAPAGNVEQTTPAGTQTPAAPGAPQPVAPPAEVPAPSPLTLEPEAPVTPDPSTETQYDYEPTGSANLDYALQYVGDLGYGPAHPAILEAQKGNFALIRAELARKGVAGADAVVAIAESSYKELQAKHQEQATALTNFAHEVAGSAENWSQVQTWARANADPAEKQQINAALSQGGVLAKSVINFLVETYSKQNTLNRSPRSAVQPGAAAAPVVIAGPLSKGEYGRAVAELSAKYPGRDISGLPEYQSLQQRRLMGMRSGR